MNYLTLWGIQSLIYEPLRLLQIESASLTLRLKLAGIQIMGFSIVTKIHLHLSDPAPRRPYTLGA